MAVPSHPALASLPATKRALLNLLKKRGELGAASLAQLTGMTVSGVRQQLAALERDGLVTFVPQRAGPGRPGYLYRLTPAADALYPRTYPELTNELLDYVADDDPELLERIFARRRERRIARARARLAGKTFDQRVAELTAILDEDGYLADVSANDDGSYTITEHNCAIFSVAQRYGQACGSELDFIRAVLDDAEVERIAHMVAGAHHCSYLVRKRTAS